MIIGANVFQRWEQCLCHIYSTLEFRSTMDCTGISQFSGLVVRVPGYRSRDSRFDTRHHQIFWVVGLEGGPFSRMRITEEVLEWTSSGSGDLLRWPHNTLYPQKLVLTSPKGSGRSVGIVCLQTQAMEFSLDVITEVMEWKHRWYRTLNGTVPTEGPHSTSWWSIVSVPLLVEHSSMFRQSSTDAILWMAATLTYCRQAHVR
jgi:hypothetical protein